MMADYPETEHNQKLSMTFPPLPHANQVIKIPEKPALYLYVTLNHSCLSPFVLYKYSSR